MMAKVSLRYSDFMVQGGCPQGSGMGVDLDIF